LREIQAKRIEIEDIKKDLASRELELNKDYRMLEKKKELLTSDKLEMENKWRNFIEE
jgi:hypothetical protein